MAPRYSDRFFGPQGVSGRGVPPGEEKAAERAEPGPAVAPTLGSHAVTSDEIDLVGGAPSPAGEQTYGASPGARPWHAELWARAAVVSALVVGLVLGAYGWEEWRDRQAENVAQSVVDVAADVGILTFDPTGHRTSLSVRMTNEGSHEITVTGFEPLDPRMSGTDEDFDPVDVAPGDDLVEVVDFRLDCTADTDGSTSDQQSAVLARVTTMDGVEHEESYALTTSSMGYGGGTVTEQCSYYLPVTTFQNVYPEVSSASLVGTDAVEAQITFYSNGGPLTGEPEIVSVDAPSLAFEVAWDGSYDDSLGGIALDVTFTVEHCENALRTDESDMMVVVRGRLPSEEFASTTSTYPSTNLVAQLVRLSELVCR